MTGDPTIDRLMLEEDVAAKAQELKRAAPEVVFVSGRRTIAEQAQAMAANTVEKRNYVRDTYADSEAKDRLVAWFERAAPPADATRSQ